jgi:hypothetical protein
MRRPVLHRDSTSSTSGRDPTTDRGQFDEVRGALISAICHAHQNQEHMRPPAPLRPMPLDRVVETLVQSGNTLARVLAGCWLLDNPSRVERFEPHIAGLIGAKARDAIRFEPGMIGSISFDGPITVERPTRFAYACGLLLRDNICNPENYQISVSLDPRSLVTRVEASVDVDLLRRPPDKFRMHSDPRGWERNAPLFFKESRLCAMHDGDFETEPTPPTIGDRDYDGLLLEHVALGFAPGFPIEAINVLAVRCRSHQKSTPHFDVTTHTCLETILGPSWSRGGLDVDSGMFTATEVNGATRLLGTKLARFTERQVLGVRIGRQMNYFAPFCLAALMSTLIFGGACYDPA